MSAIDCSIFPAEAIIKDKSCIEAHREYMKMFQRLTSVFLCFLFFIVLAWFKAMKYASAGFSLNSP